MSFLCLGYYVVEPVPKPQYLKLKCRQILTVTNCICNLHPNLQGSFWQNQKGEIPQDEQTNYRKQLRLSDEIFNDLKVAVKQLFDARYLELDSRFVKLSDAVLFCKKYMYNLTDLKIVSIAIDDNFKDVLISAFNDVSWNLNIQTPMILTDLESGGKLLGYDILGWDVSSFHSYLCNSLNNDISLAYPLEVDDFGIIQNQYDEVIKFAEYIKDKGEPVDWLPFAMYDYSTLRGNCVTT